MKQADLDRVVARVTGETVSTIKRLGFGLADPDDGFDPDPNERAPYVIDWDGLQARCHQAIAWRPHDEPTAT